jgi:hypothetical protein
MVQPKGLDLEILAAMHGTALIVSSNFPRSRVSWLQLRFSKVNIGRKELLSVSAMHRESLSHFRQR